MAGTVAAQDVGSIRGVVSDRDFDSPIPGVVVQVLGKDLETTTGPRGDYVLEGLEPGVYTLVFTGDGYQRQVRTPVQVSANGLTDEDVFLSGDFADMEEFIVEDVQLDAGSEAGLLQLRLDSPALLDSISAELMSQAGASDAGAALNLVAGATVQDGKYATIRGLPDRYVPTLLNGVRLPTSDEDKRAVQLDLFPSAVIESIQVSKSFTPDQQGDSSGGSVDIVLKGIPEESFLKFKTEYKWNSQVRNRDDFLTYRGGGVSQWGDDGGQRDIPGVKNPLADPAEWVYDFDGQALGTDTGIAPPMYKWSADLGLRHEFDEGLTIGGFASFFYDRDAAYSEDGQINSYVVDRGDGVDDRSALVPQVGGQDGQPIPGNDFETSLFDVTEGVQTVQWGTLLTGGVEWDNHSIGLTFLYSRTTEDSAVLAEDTRGRQWFVDTYYPDSGPYDPYDLQNPANAVDNRFSAPYLRSQTLNYVERTTQSLQLAGSHLFPLDDAGPAVPGVIAFNAIEFDWNVSDNRARQNEPDKVQFGSRWLAPAERITPIAGDFYFWEYYSPAYAGLLPGPNVNLGNIQHVYKDIEETSRQYSGDLKLLFEQWTEDEGYLKFGFFNDNLDRTYDQETFANYRSLLDPLAGWPTADYPYFDGGTGAILGLNPTDPDPGGPPPGPGWDDIFWSDVAPYQGFPITAGGALNPDVDYTGNQRISAYYAMADVPIVDDVNLIGGYRFESTEISIVNQPGPNAKWFPAGSTALVDLRPGDADVDFKQFDLLPSLAMVWAPDPTLTLRGAFSRTTARQTFKELSPILQQEYLGGPIFVGNPDLVMSSLQNYDLRVDWSPYGGSLFSASWFRKRVTDPIEYVERGTPSFSFTTPENYPVGWLEGFEVEARIGMGELYEPLTGLTIGGNATLIDSQVQVAQEDLDRFELAGVTADLSKRDMTGAPNYLYNVYSTVGLEDTGTNIGLFYTAQGETLLSGAGINGNFDFIPSIYAKPVGTLNFTVTQRLFENFQVFFKAKNLTNPDIRTVYRSPSGSYEATRSTYTSGIDLSLGITASFDF